MTEEIIIQIFCVVDQAMSQIMSAAHHDHVIVGTIIPLAFIMIEMDGVALGKMAAPVSDPAYGLSHPGSRVGNGRQRPDDGRS
jgi:hypothetical protein